MNGKIKELEARLDGLAKKKAELVKQRDAEKLDAEKVKKQAGFDLLDGGTIDAIGGNLQKVRARIETVESGINACAATMAAVEAELKAARFEWAKDKAAAISKEADKVLDEVIADYVKLANKTKSLKDMRAEVRALASNYNAPIIGRAVHDEIGFLWQFLQNTLDQIKRLDPSINDKIPRLT